MNKKIFIAVVLLLVLCGCSRQDKTVKDVAILTSEKDEAVILFCDRNDSVIKELEISYPSDVLQAKDGLFYTTGDYCYHFVSNATFKEEGRLEKIYGDLIYGSLDGNSYYSYEGGIYSNLKGVNTLLEDGNGTKTVFVEGGYLFTIKDSGEIHIYNTAANQLVSSSYLPQSEIYEACMIDGRLFLAEEFGYVEIVDGNLGIFYVFDRTFDYIEGAKGDLLILVQQGVRNIYKVSFDAHRMILEPYEDSTVGQRIEFEKLFEEYYEKGFEAEYFLEY